MRLFNQDLLYAHLRIGHLTVGKNIDAPTEAKYFTRPVTLSQGDDGFFTELIEITDRLIARVLRA
ncbi:Uncharacterised protein [Vibrio cholerae]|nr:Uncharacterised protein [Vibrio cholerae]CSI56260.1 Uncharacterised protein [Vibrio cholerae]